MNSKLFLEAMNEVGDKYYEEVSDYERTRKKLSIVKWGAVAACAAAIGFTAFSVLPGYLNRQDITPPDSSGINTADSFETADDIPPDNSGISIADNFGTADDNPPTTPELHISMEHIYLNEIKTITDTSRRWYDPDLYEYIVWNKETIISYYGKDLTPTYTAGLTASPKNETATVIADKNGNIVNDDVWLSFYYEYNEDSSEKPTENNAVHKSFTIIVSRIGILNECYYIMPKNEVQYSDIEGTMVAFGHRSVPPYGSFDPKTLEPSDYYDMYVAEFEQEEIEYQIVARQMEIEEFVKVVSSIICGESDN